jgi:Protein  of unknown function (DUF3018)
MSRPAKLTISNGARRVAAYRQRKREAGLVPKTIWVHDMKDPAFVADLQRQCRAIAANVEQEKEIMGWIEAMQSDLDLGPAPEYRLPEKK